MLRGRIYASIIIGSEKPVGLPHAPCVVFRLCADGDARAWGKPDCADRDNFINENGVWRNLDARSLFCFCRV